MSSCAVKKKKKKFFSGHAELFSDLARYGSVKIAGNTVSTFFPDFLNALTLRRSPTLQAGLRENELRRWLRQDVVAKYLLERRRCCWGSAHRVQKHWSAFLVLRPSWCRVVNILEARRDLNRKTTDMSFLYRCQTQSVFQAVSSHSQWLNLHSVAVSSIYGTDVWPKYQNSYTTRILWFKDTRKNDWNDYHISDVFDFVFPHMSLLDPGHHCDGAGATICHSLLHDLFGLLLGVAGRSRTTVWRGSGVVIWRVQVSRVILFSLCILLIVLFETFYCEGPAVLCTPVERVRSVLKLVLLSTPCIYSPFSQNGAWLNLEHNSWPGRNMPLCY